ncbi:hypothetical protein PQX77_020949 [Marasmius sp. AFHP31]|nr:hypothetical protein PQX77_020949 [Marasmius sp. AFHP31]
MTITWACSPLPTKFADVLDTNYVPSNEDLREMNAIIRGPQEEIRRIDVEISRLQSRRDELQQFVDRHRKLLSPFRRFPEDIWREVFVQILPDTHLPTRNTAEAPLSLTSICRSWRDIALSTPQLWNSIHLFLPSPPQDLDEDDFAPLLEARKEGLKLWLARSGSLPLTISLAMGSFPIERPSLWYSYSEITKLIAGYSRRWLSLSLYYLHPRIIEPFQTLTGGDLPLLEGFYELGTLRHPLTLIPPDQPLSPFLRTIGSANLVHDLRIGIQDEVVLFSIPIQWMRLRTLRVDTEREVDGVVMLRGLAEACPLLSDLSFTFLERGLGQQFSSGTVYPRQWNHLHRLDLHVTGDGSEAFESAVLRMFESITTPSLSHLSLHLSIFYAPDDMETRLYPTEQDLPFRNLVARSQCPLVTLDLEMPLGTGFHTTLDNLTSLTTLSLRSPTWDPRSFPSDPSFRSHLNAVLQTLTPSDEMIWYPNVEQLTLRFCIPQHALVLVALIESRARVTPLRSFTVDFGSVSSKENGILVSALELVESKDLGVKIKWQYEVIPIRRDPRDPRLYSNSSLLFSPFYPLDS